MSMAMNVRAAPARDGRGYESRTRIAPGTAKRDKIGLNLSIAFPSSFAVLQTTLNIAHLKDNVNNRFFLDITPLF